MSVILSVPSPQKVNETENFETKLSDVIQGWQKSTQSCCTVERDEAKLRTYIQNYTLEFHHLLRIGP